MKKQTKKETPKFVLSKENLLRRNPIPFGDVRKYYLAMKIGTVVLFALLFYMSFAAVLTRTEYKVQISNVVIGCLLLLSLASVIGLYSRTILGYGITVVASVIIFVLLQYSNGTGIAFDAESLFYGEKFIKGIQSMAFWIILSKVLSVLQMALAIVFIRSTIKVTEEPPVTGMNVKIQKFREWLSKHNDSLKDGRRPLDYVFIVASVLLYIGYFVGDSTMMMYDYCSLAFFIVGIVLVVLRQVLPGAFFFCCSALLRCNLYQYRFGYILPVIAAYLGMWLAVLYMAFASAKKRRAIRINNERKWIYYSSELLMWESVAIGVLSFSLHQIFGDYVHEFLYLSELKDNLPIIFFVPLICFLLIRSKQWYGCLGASALYLFLWAIFRQVPQNAKETPLLDCSGLFQHNSERIIEVSNSFMKVVVLGSSAFCFLIGIVVLIDLRRKHNA